MVLITGTLAYSLIATIMSVSIGMIIYLKWSLKYWNRVGLETLNPMLLFGDTKSILLGHIYFGEQFHEFYRTFKAKGLKHGGVYFGKMPFYIPTDPDIIKHILQKDFHHFVNHETYIDEETDVLSGNLFNQRDEKWKKLRMIMTAGFTTSRIRKMFKTLTNCAVNLKDVIENSVKIHEPLDVSDILVRFIVEADGLIAFGVQNNSLKDPDNFFLKYNRKLLKVHNLFERIVHSIQFIIPECVLRVLKYRTTNPHMEKFFIKTVRDVVEFREKNNIYKEDFLQLLIELKERNAATLNDLIALAYTFFLGSDTSAMTATMALYQLAINPHVQNILRDEINTVLAKHDGNLTYEAVMEMTYMNKVLFETLRLHTTGPLLTRKCTKDYTIPNTNIRLRVGDCVGISVLGLHSDGEYFPEPEVFDPERFSEENKNCRPDFTFLPFGKGPRQCVASRFGMLQTKVALCTILKDYKVVLNKKTEQPLVMDKKCIIILGLEGGVWVDLERV